MRSPDLDLDEGFAQADFKTTGFVHPLTYNGNARVIPVLNNESTDVFSASGSIWRTGVNAYAPSC